MAATVGAGEHPLRREVLWLLQLAMVVFVWTVGIGILNGTDVVDFSQKVILSHVHAGTLGWITTCVFAATLWLFGERDRSIPVDRSIRNLEAARAAGAPVEFRVFPGLGHGLLNSMTSGPAEVWPAVSDWLSRQKIVTQ